MRYYLFILFTLISSCVFAQERWAIIVGISNYPTESGWDKINGANDIGIIVPMLQRNGFPLTNITTLSNEQATKANIKGAITAISHKIKNGDIVYFHFSGHGQQVVDISGDEGLDPYDEAIVPYDALRYKFNNYQGEYHILDDELNLWLWDIRNIIGDNGKIIVVLDSCFSCDATRGDENVPARGGVSKLKVSHFANGIRQPIIQQLPINWICISACDDKGQTNHEYKINNVYYGRLSYLLSCIKTLEISIQELQTILEEGYNRINLETKLKQTHHIDLPNNWDISHVL